MMKSTNTKGFTLVELIIVITILAILATIAFISFQGYTKDSRNSKRAADLNSISRAIEVKGAEGVEIINFASSVTASEVASIELAGYSGGNVPTGKYVAGEINFTALGVANQDSFKDPLNGTYKIGVTTLAGGVYQLASIKEVDSTKEAYVIGTFKSRAAGDTATGTIAQSGSNKILTLTEGLGLFKKGDIVKSTGTGEVIAISGDLTRLTISGSISNETTATGVTLDKGESAGLIASGTVVISNTNLPY